MYAKTHKMCLCFLPVPASQKTPPAALHIPPACWTLDSGPRQPPWAFIFCNTESLGGGRKPQTTDKVHLFQRGIEPKPCFCSPSSSGRKGGSDPLIKTMSIHFWWAPKITHKIQSRASPLQNLRGQMGMQGCCDVCLCNTKHSCLKIKMGTFLILQNINSMSSEEG